MRVWWQMLQICQNDQNRPRMRDFRQVGSPGRDFAVWPLEAITSQS